MSSGEDNGVGRSILQKKASARNWMKARIKGFRINGSQRSVLLPYEIELLERIEELQNVLLENWDRNSELCSVIWKRRQEQGELK